MMICVPCQLLGGNCKFFDNFLSRCRNEKVCVQILWFNGTQTLHFLFPLLDTVTGRFFAAVCIQRCVFSIAFFSKNIAGKFLNHPDCKSSVMNSAGFMAAKVAARVAAALFGPKSAIFMPRNHKRR